MSRHGQRGPQARAGIASAARGLRRLHPGDLVAVDLPPGPAWLAALETALEAGAAVLPLDPRLAGPERDELLARARPTHAFDGEELVALGGGLPVNRAVRLVVATSGSGGRPKLVELTLGAVEAAARASSEALGAGPTDRWLCCLPPAHVGGLLVLLRGVLLGAPVVVHPRFDPAAVDAEPGVAFVSVVPTMLLRLLDAGVDLTRFRAVLVGGAATPPGLAERAGAAGARIVRTYGCTESCGGVVYDGLPLRATEVRIGEGGEVLLRGPTLMRGYLRDPASTAATLVRGWLRTGDGGHLDPRGRLVVDGRLDEAIRTGGERVWPQEVEAALADHPGIAEVAVAGRPDPEWGERVVAFVVPRDPARPPSLEDLRAHAAGRIARFKVPRELVVVDALPRTSSGKVRRAALPG
ncbi:MAG TPA: AMP-binding protein [Actinomycetota bacterium]|nr:AMP-binding protein [Actinomycetota bacterium]